MKIGYIDNENHNSVIFDDACQEIIEVGEAANIVIGYAADLQTAMHIMSLTKNFVLTFYEEGNKRYKVTEK